MIAIEIHGIKDGIYEIDKSVSVEDIPDLSEEFFGNIVFKGHLRKIGRRFSIEGTAKCSSRLICDLTLTEYSEEIVCEITASFLADTLLYWKSKENFQGSDDTIIIHEDDKTIDLSDELRQQLALTLPLKRIAPDAKDIEIEKIYPDYFSSGSPESESTGNNIWDSLKKIKIN
ncbi:MAG: hypothetical protein HW421_634 [Ignavibacteria bacterium]|nr:hypothetical protein [Ignavibacteria bacterium]